jgi:hypothetical protein
MSNNNVKIWLALFTVFVLIMAFALFFTVTPDLMALADGGAHLTGKCIGSAAGSCQVGGF